MSSINTWHGKVMSLAEAPKNLPENPRGRLGVERDDVLSSLLSRIRLSGSLQFCFMPSGDWQTDGVPAMSRLAARANGAMPFHVVVEGECWLKMDGIEASLEAGDVVLFPFGTGHQLGSGSNGRLVLPTRDLPPKPWRDIPMLRYGEEQRPSRLLCGYLQCDTLGFAPLRDALPTLIHVRTRGANDLSWMSATISQMVAEVDRPRAGGVAMLGRLTEILFIEILRHRMTTAKTPGDRGWLAALADPALTRCLSLLHAAPDQDWSIEALALASGLSRSSLSERFRIVLNTSPIRYLRDWRLYLASQSLLSADQSITAIAYQAGYATEAAFSRAFSRCFGSPPAAWRSEIATETA
ncbi:AraC family transcriptional regulator [Lacibacterium aquatile]|uniref:AraC family transcriptional regulator n=1 Tax=Lacibacterium aquatile TaxID=1168082 RepID=A0ABW5DSC0_9PROT